MSLLSCTVIQNLKLYFLSNNSLTFDLAIILHRFLFSLHGHLFLEYQ